MYTYAFMERIRMLKKGNPLVLVFLLQDHIGHVKKVSEFSGFGFVLCMHRVAGASRGNHLGIHREVRGDGKISWISFTSSPHYSLSLF